MEYFNKIADHKINNFDYPINRAAGIAEVDLRLASRKIAKSTGTYPEDCFVSQLHVEKIAKLYTSDDPMKDKERKDMLSVNCYKNHPEIKAIVINLFSDIDKIVNQFNQSTKQLIKELNT